MKIFLVTYFQSSCGDRYDKGIFSSLEKAKAQAMSIYEESPKSWEGESICIYETELDGDSPNMSDFFDEQHKVAEFYSEGGGDNFAWH